MPWFKITERDGSSRKVFVLSEADLRVQLLPNQVAEETEGPFEELVPSEGPDAPTAP